MPKGIQGFQKGHKDFVPAGSRGHSEETKKKIGLSKIGNKNMVGRKLSEETKRKISIAHIGKGRGPRPWSEERRKKHNLNLKPKTKKACLICDKQFLVSPSGMGIKYCSFKCRNIGIKQNPNRYWLGKKRPDLSVRFKGSGGSNWQGGRTPLNKIIRRSLEYRLWRTAVFERDKYTCIWCKATRCELNADHIKSFAQYPELRFAIDNGRTLCVPCHKTTDTYLKNPKTGNCSYYEKVK